MAIELRPNSEDGQRLGVAYTRLHQSISLSGSSQTTGNDLDTSELLGAAHGGAVTQASLPP